MENMFIKGEQKFENINIKTRNKNNNKKIKRK